MPDAFGLPTHHPNFRVSTYETSQTSTRRVGMCEVGASRKFVSEEVVAILRHSAFGIHVLLAAFWHRAENWGASRVAGFAEKVTRV